jgi:hypothetical protein
LEVPIDAVELTPPNNTTAQPWKDLLSSLTDRTILVTNNLGDAADPTPVVTYLSSLATEKTPGGCSTRWAIAATFDIPHVASGRVPVLACPSEVP